MPFSNFKNLKQVIQKYPLKIRKERFLPEVQLEPPEWFIENLNFSLDRNNPVEKAVFLRESLIFPFLQLAWKRHQHLELWALQELVYDDNLSGEPDYLVSVWRDEVIDKPINTPLLAVAEAKKQDFEGGWARNVWRK